MNKDWLEPRRIANLSKIAPRRLSSIAQILQVCVTGLGVTLAGWAYLSWGQQEASKRRAELTLDAMRQELRATECVTSVIAGAPDGSDWKVMHVCLHRANLQLVPCREHKVHLELSTALIDATVEREPSSDLAPFILAARTADLNTLGRYDLKDE